MPTNDQQDKRIQAGMFVTEAAGLSMYEAPYSTSDLFGGELLTHPVH